jgi:hypothetical protein
MENVGEFQYNDLSKPFAVTNVMPNYDAMPYSSVIPLREQKIAYTSFMCPDTITENGYQAIFTYNAAADRVRMEVADLGSQNVQFARYYISNYEVDFTHEGTT